MTYFRFIGISVSAAPCFSPLNTTSIYLRLKPKWLDKMLGRLYCSMSDMPYAAFSPIAAARRFLAGKSPPRVSLGDAVFAFRAHTADLDTRLIRQCVALLKSPKEGSLFAWDEISFLPQLLNYVAPP